MPSPSKTALTATAALAALIQFCPAPFLAVIPEAIAVGLSSAEEAIDVAADVAGTVSRAARIGKDVNDAVNDLSGNNDNNKKKRAEQNQLAWQECHDQLATASLTFSSPSNGSKLSLVVIVVAVCFTNGQIKRSSWMVCHRLA